MLYNAGGKLHKGQIMTSKNTYFHLQKGYCLYIAHLYHYKLLNIIFMNPQIEKNYP
jgi:hypothetical protein